MFSAIEANVYCPELEISQNNHPGILNKIREISEHFVSLNCWELHVSLEEGKCSTWPSIDET